MSLSDAVFFRTYSRYQEDLERRESWEEVCIRTVSAIAKVGDLTGLDELMMFQMQLDKKVMVSGRWLWLGGTKWIDKPGNNYGAYNCNSIAVNDIDSFAISLNLAAMGVGTGTVISDEEISKLPTVKHQFNVEYLHIPPVPKDQRNEFTSYLLDNDKGVITISIGDSRIGWVQAYKILLDLYFSEDTTVKTIFIDSSNVRGKGERLKGFGGVANPSKLESFFLIITKILNNACGRRLNVLEVCRILDEGSVLIVAGNIRRTASIRQGSSNNNLFTTMKDNLWIQDDQGKWKIDPERSSLRVANHTRLFFEKPTLDMVLEAVTKQFYSGEGAIQNVQEALYRANIDLTKEQGKLISYSSEDKEKQLRQAITSGQFREYLEGLGFSGYELDHRLKRYGANPCATSDTWVMTNEGARQVKDLIGIPFIAAVNGQYYPSTLQGFWSSGVKPVYKISFKDGRFLKLTDNHKILKLFKDSFEWCRVKDARIGDKISVHDHRNLESWGGEGTDGKGYIIGQLLGNGCLSKTQWNDTAHLRFWDEGLSVVDYVRSLLLSEFNLEAKGYSHQQNNYFEFNSTDVAKYAAKFGLFQGNKKPNEDLEKTSSKFYIGFLRGLFDADGTVGNYGGGRRSVRLTQSDESTLLMVQRMLGRLGINSKIYLNRQKAGQRLVPDSQKNLKLYDCKAVHELVITKENILRFSDLIGFARPDKLEKLASLVSSYSLGARKENYLSTISDIQLIGEEEVFDCTIINASRYDANGLVISNCFEIIGYDFLCNLSEVHLNQFDSEDREGLHNALVAASLSVCSLLHHNFDVPRLQKSREIDPIVGVSFTGLFDYFVKYFGVDWLKWWELGRPKTTRKFRGFWHQERLLLNGWREIVEQTVFDYCIKHKIRVPNRATCVQPGGCLAKETVRVFDQGLFYLDEIIDEGAGKIDDVNLSVRNGIKVNSAIANQPKQLIKITLNNKRILRMTPDHRLSIEGEWIAAEEMIQGMKIDYQLGGYAKDTEEGLIGIDLFEFTREGRAKVSGNNKGLLSQEIITPKETSPKLAYFLGALFGSGWCDDKRVRISHENMEILERLNSLSNELFGITGNIFHDKFSDKKHELCIASKQLIKWLQLNDLCKIGKSKDLDRIPKAIRSASKASLLSFFCGLIDTDGCIRKEGSLSIDSASEKFLRNLQEIGESIGLSFSIFHNTQGQNLQGNKDMWGLCLSRMASLPESIDFLNENCWKTIARKIPKTSKKIKSHSPYAIASVEYEEVADFSYDIVVDGLDDDDSWYWQGSLKSHNTKSLLTGASCGWHPPKAQRYIRRVTFSAYDPVALTLIKLGYKAIPADSAKDDHGVLLDDIHDPRSTEWLIEFPTEVSWASLEGADQIDISKFSATAQFDFFMQIQSCWTRHNTSATIEFREHEIEDLSKAIYQAIQDDAGFISAALLARFDSNATFPRLPYEPINKQQYEEEIAGIKNRCETSKEFLEVLKDYDLGLDSENVGALPCDSDKCLLPEIPIQIV